jgi:delta 1-pyrroline-5-carboxylate dehydrogenase
MSHRPPSGQGCSAGSRVFVQDRVYNKFIELLIEKAKSTPIGDGFDDTISCGPVVSERAAGTRSAIHGLTKRFDRSRKPNSIRCGVTSSPESKRVPKSWPAEKGVGVGAIL